MLGFFFFFFAGVFFYVGEVNDLHVLGDVRPPDNPGRVSARARSLISRRPNAPVQPLIGRVTLVGADGTYANDVSSA